MALTLGATDWAGWTSMEIYLSLEAGAGSFELALTERWSDGQATRPMTPGEACAVTADGEPLVSGWLDDVRLSYDDQQHSIAVYGRDRAGDLVDCSAEPAEWHNLALSQIVGLVAAPFGVAVKAETSLGEPFETFRVNEGETAWSAIARACRARGVLCMSDGQGNVTLTRARTGTADVAITRGGPKATLQTADATYTWRDRFDRYVVKGQRGGLSGTAEERASVIAEATDPWVGRYRPKIVIASDPHDQASAARHAQWECNVAAGKSRRFSVRVAGWRDEAERLWRPNRLVHLTCPWLQVDRDLLVASVHLSISEEGGTVANLDLADPAAFEVEPLDGEGEPGW